MALVNSYQITVHALTHGGSGDPIAVTYSIRTAGGKLIADKAKATYPSLDELRRCVCDAVGDEQEALEHALKACFNADGSVKLTAVNALAGKTYQLTQSITQI